MERLKKANNILICVFLIVAGLYYGAGLLIPFTFAIFFAMLVLPVAKLLEVKAGVGRLTSSFAGTLIIFLGVGLLFFFIINEMTRFLADIVERREEILAYFETLRENVASKTRFSMERQDEMLRESLLSIINVTQSYISGFLTDLIGSLLDFLLILVFIFLLLVNRNKIVDFLMMYIPQEKKPETKEVVGETSRVAHQYLWGRIKVMTILAIMYLIAFIAYDMQHIGLLVVFGALITIIPFIGPFLSGLLPILFMIGFGGTYTEIISFTILIAIIQLIESYVLEPLIMGSEMQQSPLFVIIAVLFGGLVWGPAGFILFVPLFAMVKIICDHIPALKPVGFLMGYERPGSGGGILEKIKKKFHN